MLSERYDSLKQGVLPTGNRACDVRSAANAFLMLYTTIVCTQMRSLIGSI